jgi:acyl-ACP thioesterase
MAAPLFWTESVPVRSSDATLHGTASLPALCVYLQETAGHHADALGVSMQDLLADDRAWVLSHLHLDLDRPPHWQETVTIETWPSGLDGLYTTREFVLSVDDELIGRATSRWFVIDTERRRPARPPRPIRDLDWPDRPPALPHDFDDVPGPDHAEHEHTTTARYYDLDLNGHVNSMRYLTWALTTLPDAVLTEHQCTGLALQFRAEAILGTPIRATAQTHSTGEGHTARHALHHAEDDRILATARTRWVERAG